MTRPGYAPISQCSSASFAPAGRGPLHISGALGEARLASRYLTRYAGRMRERSPMTPELTREAEG